VLLCLGLAFCVVGSIRTSEPSELLTFVTGADVESIDVELSLSEPIGGGGGPTSLTEGKEMAVSSLTRGEHFAPIVPLLELPDSPVVGQTPGPGTGRGRGTGRGDGTGSRQAIGKKAVTEGSFTVWTVPDDPLPGENYLILIEVKLPEKVLRYPRSDISGLVTGTDGWRQPLPGNAAPVHPYLPVEDHTVQLQVEVPGGGRRVEDVVKVRSRLLKEEQVLKLVF
jgi:hypothetical protein